MLARRGRGKEEPAPHSSPSPAPDDDSEVPAWRAGYETCPACRRPVRRERLARHMELLHPDYRAVEPASEPVPPPPPPNLLQRLLGRIRRGRKA
jgi:hypothetical protein